MTVKSITLTIEPRLCIRFAWCQEVESCCIDDGIQCMLTLSRPDTPRSNLFDLYKYCFLIEVCKQYFNKNIFYFNKQVCFICPKALFLRREGLRGVG